MKYGNKNYTEVKDRIKEFRIKKAEDLRANGWSIITDMVWHNDDMSAVLFKATIREPMVANAAFSYIPQIFTGWAYEERIKELSISSSGKEFEDVNFSSWVENAETSAIGRALANMDILALTLAAPNDVPRPASEEMGKVERVKAAAKKPEAKTEGAKQKFEDVVNAIGKEIDELTGKPFYAKLLKSQKVKSADEIITMQSKEDFYKNCKGFRDLIKSLLAPYGKDDGSGTVIPMRISELEKADQDKIFNQLDMVAGL